MTSIFKNRDTLLNCEARAQLTQNLLFFRQKEKLEGDQAWIHHERQLIEVEKSACRAKRASKLLFLQNCLLFLQLLSIITSDYCVLRVSIGINTALHRVKLIVSPDYCVLRVWISMKIAL